jgi:hypothetical protein
MYICDRCREQVRPASEPGIVYAVQLIRTESFGTTVESPGPTVEYIEGLGSFFHEQHFPVGSPLWRRKPMPDGVGDGDE